MNDVEITSMNGQSSFPKNDNDVYQLIEKIALQELTGLKSANQFRDGLRHIKVENGKVLEQSVVKIAERYIFDKNSTSRAPLDPTLAVTYHNNFYPYQYKTSVRKDDIRAIIANKGLGVEKVVAEVLDTLTQGDAKDDYNDSMNLLYGASFVNYLNVTGKTAKNIKGVLYIIRDMYNACKFNNSEFTTAHNFVSATPEANIRIAMSTKLSNLIDVSALADILNLSKVELMGKINLFDVSYDSTKNPYSVFVYDINAIGCAERLLEVEMERVVGGRFDNAYLTNDRAYYYCGLFKGMKANFNDACTTAEAEILDSYVPFSVTATLTNCSGDNITEVGRYDVFDYKVTADLGKQIAKEDVDVKMGGVAVDDKYIKISLAKDVVTIHLPIVTGNITIDVEAKAPTLRASKKSAE